MDIRKLCLSYGLFLLVYMSNAASETVLHAFDGIVGAGNYTYYRLSRKGHLMILLQSLTGDADLYVSNLVEEPTYEINDLQSTTCGEDYIEIQAEYRRPVSIGVYGHVFKHISHYRLLVVADHSNDSDAGKGTKKGDHDDEEESILWQIFVGILKILLDILL